VASCPSIPLAGEVYKGGGGVLKEGEGVEKRGGAEGGVGGLNCFVVKGAGSVCFAPYDRHLLLRTRENMPVQTHRRPDIYYSRL
jgi:hypothetical protein